VAGSCCLRISSAASTSSTVLLWLRHMDAAGPSPSPPLPVLLVLVLVLVLLLVLLLLLLLVVCGR